MQIFGYFVLASVFVLNQNAGQCHIYQDKYDTFPYNIKQQLKRKSSVHLRCIHIILLNIRLFYCICFRYFPYAQWEINRKKHTIKCKFDGFKGINLKF
jgi:hypothetical protein